MTPKQKRDAKNARHRNNNERRALKAIGFISGMNEYIDKRLKRLADERAKIEN